MFHQTHSFLCALLLRGGRGGFSVRPPGEDEKALIPVYGQGWAPIARGHGKLGFCPSLGGVQGTELLKVVTRSHRGGGGGCGGRGSHAMSETNGGYSVGGGGGGGGTRGAGSGRFDDGCCCCWGCCHRGWRHGGGGGRGGSRCGSRGASARRVQCKQGGTHCHGIIEGGMVGFQGASCRGSDIHGHLSKEGVVGARASEREGWGGCESLPGAAKQKGPVFKVTALKKIKDTPCLFQSLPRPHLVPLGSPPPSPALSGSPLLYCPPYQAPCAPSQPEGTHSYERYDVPLFYSNQPA